MNSCSPASLGYSPVQGMDCLPHTGIDLWPIMLIGVALIVVGLIIHLLLRMRDN